MTESLVDDLVVLPPVADDPIFSEPSPVPSAGDPHGFAALYIRHRWSFQLHARRFLSDQRDIDEVVQEGFLKLFLALPELETELQALAYARRTITNLCIDRYRADQRRPRLVDLESIPTSALPEEDDETDPLIQAEDAALVREALAMLSPLHREALIKREIEEKPLPQIAAELDIPVEQVKHVLHRARRSLRKLLVGTHVEPGVDLDLALVLEANRVRATKAAKPMGAAVLTLFMVLAGVLGLRPGGSEPRVTGSIDRPTGVPGMGPGDVTHTPSMPQAHAPAARPVPVRGVPSRPAGRTAKPRRLTLPPAVPVLTPLAAKPPVAPSVTPALPPSGGAYTVSGLAGARSAVIAGEQRDQSADGSVSRSSVLSATPRGVYALRQAFTFGTDGGVTGAALSESVPAADGSTVETVLKNSTTTSSIGADGTVRLTTVGSAQQLGAPVLDTARTITVDLVLDAEHLQVLTESVNIRGGEPLSAEQTSPLPVLPTSPDPGAQLAPQPLATPALEPSTGAQDPTGPAEAVAVP